MTPEARAFGAWKRHPRRWSHRTEHVGCGAFPCEVVQLLDALAEKQEEVKQWYITSWTVAGTNERLGAAIREAERLLAERDAEIARLRADAALRPCGGERRKL